MLTGKSAELDDVVVDVAGIGRAGPLYESASDGMPQTAVVVPRHTAALVHQQRQDTVFEFEFDVLGVRAGINDFRSVQQGFEFGEADDVLRERFRLLGRHLTAGDGGVVLGDFEGVPLVMVDVPLVLRQRGIVARRFVVGQKTVIVQIRHRLPSGRMAT
jgi:hypothetical protein